ncbi:4'-phosphopantetheinyl transferase family protein [Streptomyces sp. URMC 123]|uniref:4'-phosphopantetheinyl transferase family protein n=1 Tax=Streptomyces sp. URMC 123 TaxID=3423403 RepID=UPI003F196272
MLSELLPAGVVCAEAFEDTGEEELFPEERALVAAAVERRRREFATVRACARRALAGLGLPPVPVLPGVRNVPRWPAGVVGSMTHCDGYRAAALARADEVTAVGIDAEPDLPLPDGVLETIGLPRERAGLRAAPLPGGVHGDRLLFSAKECVYKTWFPLMRSELDFTDAEITFAAFPTGWEGGAVVGEGVPARQRTARDAAPEAAGGRSGTFRARLLRPGRDPHGRVLDGFTGRWLARGGLLVTAIALPAPAATAAGDAPPGGAHALPNATR